MPFDWPAPNTKSLELRAAMSLSQLRVLQGKKREAYSQLFPIYAEFTEQADTKDLQSAGILLDRLR